MAKYADMGERIRANSILSGESSYNDTACWIWIGHVDRSGYGRLNVRWKSGPRKGKVRTIYAHRESLRVHTGRTVRKDYVVKHLCNNPCCVNPLHLQGGTQATNIRQCVAEGRHFTPFRKERLAA